MRAVQLMSPGGPDALELVEPQRPEPAGGEVLLKVHAAAITRDELEWPVDRLPAIPSYEVSGVVEAVGAEVELVHVGDEVYALTPFDRDGMAAEYAVAPAAVLAPKPQALGHVEAAAVPLAALSAWQGLFDHGALGPGERVLVTGAAGGVGQFATQLARWRGAHVVGVTSAGGTGPAAALGANEVVELDVDSPPDSLEPVDLVFDTAGHGPLRWAATVVRRGGRLVSVAEEPPHPATDARTSYFVVEPNANQLRELARLIDDDALRPEVDAVFGLEEARAAFERVEARGKRGKVVLRVVRDDR